MDIILSKTFGKSEKLCHQKDIDELFKKGTSFVSYPLRVIYLKKSNKADIDKIIKVLISVPKRNFKRANKRNRIKRLIRETYRLNAGELKSSVTSESIDVAFLFLAKEMPTYVEVEKGMNKALLTLHKAIKDEDSEEVID